MNEVEKAFKVYLDKLDRLVKQNRLVAFHAQEVAKKAEKAANLALLTSYHVNEYLKKVKNETKTD